MVQKVNRVVTFYSYKGGVGRSMAMANIGALLARWGLKTLVIDWDLEAPGLENYYRSYADAERIRQQKGLIDLLVLKKQSPDAQVSDINWDEYITPIRLNESELYFMNAGKQDEDYVQKVRQFDFIAFYKNNDGGQYIEDLRDYWLDHYDFILIDSRTGLTDSSGICSIHMPDILVLLFTPNEQSFAGTKSVSEKAILAQKEIVFDRFELRTLPIPSRIENAETSLFDKWMQKIYSESETMLEWLPRREDRRTEFLITPAQFLNQIKIPYKTLYAYGESLPVCDRGTADPLDLGYVYETIAAVLANDLQNTHLLVGDRDALVKKAKGEEIVDHTDFYRKIELEKEEKKRVEEEKKKIEEEKAQLETELRAQITQVSKQSEYISQTQREYTSQQVVWSKRKNRFIWYSVFFAALLGTVIYFVARNQTGKTVVLPEAVTESQEKNRRYANFISEYSSSPQQSDVHFNLAMLKRYYAFDAAYRDSLRDFKLRMENVITYKFQDRLDSFYNFIKLQKDVQSFFADTLEIFGTQRSVTGAAVAAQFRQAYKKLKITNAPDTAYPYTFFTDSPDVFHIRYSENGNVSLDGFAEYKKWRSTNLVSFDSLLRIQSLAYETTTKVSDTTVVEIFFCSGISSGDFAIGNRIASALRARPTFKVFTTTNFTPSTDPASPFFIQSNQIRYDRNSEQKIATEIQALIGTAAKTKFELVTTRTLTPNYISVFVCNNAGAQNLDFRQQSKH